jgi:hypothetical protein
MIATLHDDWGTAGRPGFPAIAAGECQCGTPRYIVGLMHLRDLRQAADARHAKLCRFAWRGSRQQTRPGPVWFHKRPRMAPGKFKQRTAEAQS